MTVVNESTDTLLKRLSITQSLQRTGDVVDTINGDSAVHSFQNVMTKSKLIKRPGIMLSQTPANASCMSYTTVYKKAISACRPKYQNGKSSISTALYMVYV